MRTPLIIAIAVIVLLLSGARAQSGAAANLPIVVNPDHGTGLETATAINSATATSTATPTEVPVTLWPNGNFEQGPVIWVAANTDTSRVVTLDPFRPVVGRSGRYVALLTDPSLNGGYGIGISQNVLIPANAPYLSYWVWIRSEDDQCGDDYTTVGMTVNATFEIVDTFPLCATAQSEKWVN